MGKTQATTDLQKLAIEYTPIDALIPYARNSRTHSPEQVAQIAASLREFGFTNPVLIDDEGGIIAGHGRVMAARKVGMDKVPTINLGHLTKTQRRAYVIADNQIAANAGWNEEMLRLEISDLDGDFDLTLLGFDDTQLAALLSGPDSENSDDKVDPTDLTAYGGATSLERGSAPLRFWREEGYLDGKSVLDFGCGKDQHEFARYDMVTQPDVGVLFKSYDVVMCNYVLNVQPSDHLIDLICLLLRSLCPGGLALISVVTDKTLSGGRACGGRDAKTPSEWQQILQKFFDVTQVDASFTGFVCKPKTGG